MQNKFQDSVELTRLVGPQYDHYCINLYVPGYDLCQIRTPEEFRGYLISKIEALIDKGAGSAE